MVDYDDDIDELCQRITEMRASNEIKRTKDQRSEVLQYMKENKFRISRRIGDNGKRGR